MLLLKTSDQLGNQMFAYASVKTIALDQGYEFRVLSKSMDGELSNDKDAVYGNTIDSIFPNVRKDLFAKSAEYGEKIAQGSTSSEEIAKKLGLKTFQEVTDIHSVSSIYKDALTVLDDTLMLGHYIAAGYFMHRIEEVREWFTFPEAVQEQALADLAMIRAKHPDKLLVSVHFRVGPDYRKAGYMLDHTYWERAAKRMLQQTGREAVFAVFYDKKDENVERFMAQFECVDIRKSLVYDLCAMSMCDAHIVCNSSFSMMTGILDVKDGSVICPSTFPIPDGYLPADCYPQQWTKVEAGHDKAAYGEYRRAMQWYRLKQRIKKLLRK